MGFTYRKPILVQPRHIPHGGVVGGISRSLIDAKDEAAFIVKFILRRQLFGHGYRILQPDYFDKMSLGSGVFVRPLVLTHEIFPGIHRPGDIDLLVIPYENDDLCLERTMAIEFKVTRAAFRHQGKSPNDFGYSQASALLDIGIPYAAVGHFITSDDSPFEFWRETMRSEVIDSDGRLGNTVMVAHDMLPSDLMTRAIGRLKANNPLPVLGLLASYLNLESHLSTTVRHGWIPEGQRASLNPRTQIRALDAIEVYFHRNAEFFLRTPRHDPPQLRKLCPC